MKGYLKLLLKMIIPLAETEGLSMENDTDPSNDLLGEGLVFIGNVAQFYLDKAAGKAVAPPALPSSLAQ